MTAINTVRSAHTGTKTGQLDGLDDEPVERGMQMCTEDGLLVLTRAQRIEYLERLLSRPFPLWTEFYVFDRIHRLAEANNAWVSAHQVLQHAVHQTPIGVKRLGEILDEGHRAGLLEREATEGESPAYRLTPIGARCLAQSKNMRLRVWELNRLEALDVVCASVAMQGGDPIFERVHEELEAIADSEKERKRAAAKGLRPARGRKINPLWSGLVSAGQ